MIKKNRRQTEKGTSAPLAENYHTFLWELLSTRSWYLHSSTAHCLQFASSPVHTWLLSRRWGFSERMTPVPPVHDLHTPESVWGSYCGLAGIHTRPASTPYITERKKIKCQYHGEIYKWWGLVTAHWICVCILSNWGQIMPQISSLRQGTWNRTCYSFASRAQRKGPDVGGKVKYHLTIDVKSRS